MKNFLFSIAAAVFFAASLSPMEGQTPTFLWQEEVLPAPGTGNYRCIHVVSRDTVLVGWSAPFQGKLYRVTRTAAWSPVILWEGDEAVQSVGTTVNGEIILSLGNVNGKVRVFALAGSIDTLITVPSKIPLISLPTGVWAILPAKSLNLGTKSEIFFAGTFQQMVQAENEVILCTSDELVLWGLTRGQTTFTASDLNSSCLKGLAVTTEGVVVGTDSFLVRITGWDPLQFTLLPTPSLWWQEPIFEVSWGEEEMSYIKGMGGWRLYHPLIPEFIPLEMYGVLWGYQGPPNLKGLLAYSVKLHGPLAVVGIQPNPTSLPAEFWLGQNYPNPFNPGTAINYKLPQVSDVKLVIYNVLGQLVKTLVNAQMQPGTYTAKWDGRNDAGTLVGSGVYIYQFIAGDFTKIQKMILMK